MSLRSRLAIAAAAGVLAAAAATPAVATDGWGNDPGNDGTTYGSNDAYGDHDDDGDGGAMTGSGVTGGMTGDATDMAGATTGTTTAAGMTGAVGTTGDTGDRDDEYDPEAYGSDEDEEVDTDSPMQGNGRPETPATAPAETAASPDARPQATTDVMAPDAMTETGAATTANPFQDVTAAAVNNTLSGAAGGRGGDGGHRGYYQGVVTASTLALRSAPNRGSQIIRYAHRGDIVSIYCKTGGETVDNNPLWYLLPDGTWAWGAARYIDNIGPAPRWC